MVNSEKEVRGAADKCKSAKKAKPFPARSRFPEENAESVGI